MAATDTATYKKCLDLVSILLDLAKRTTLIILNEVMNDIMKIVKSLEEYVSLIKGVNETIKMKQKNKMQDYSVCY